MFDYCIIGAGVSGLALAMQLMESALSDRAILLVDGANDDDALRTLSFWSPSATALDELVRHRWSTLLLHGKERSETIELASEQYQTLFFADLQREAKRRLAERPRHRVVEGRAHEIEERGDHVAIRVGAETFTARWVFDSRFKRGDLAVDTDRWHALEQRFRGWVVRTERDHFEPERATLMDFRAERPAGTAFFYVLPFSRREALVELVTLDAADPEPVFERYVSNVLQLPPYEVLAREAGVSPMTEQPFERRTSDRVRAIGIAAGRLKASTGYALTRILDDNAAIVRSLSVFGHPFEAPADSALYRVLDAVMLELWEREPARVPAIFAAMFGRSPDRVLRFLDERASLYEVLALIAPLPPGPFIRAALRWIVRRFDRSLPDHTTASQSDRENPRIREQLEAELP